MSSLTPNAVPKTKLQHFQASPMFGPFYALENYVIFFPAVVLHLELNRKGQGKHLHTHSPAWFWNTSKGSTRTGFSESGQCFLHPCRDDGISLVEKQSR